MASTLDKLRVGQSAVLEEVGGDPDYRRRLLEMGLVPGVRVDVVGVAPLGDPLTISLRGSRVSLRRAEAAHVAVRPWVHTTPAPAACRDTHRPSARVILCGPPTSGKTTLFNRLTGAHASVGNTPDLHVEVEEAALDLPTHAVQLVDMPGQRSLTASSRAEQRLLDELLRPADAVLVVLDATAMERSIYLLLQVQELGLPVVAVVNLLDEARRRGLEVDVGELAEHLGIPVVGAVARTGEGVPQLRRTLGGLLADPPTPGQWHWRPSDDLDSHLRDLAPHMEPLVGPGAPDTRRRAAALWALMSLRPDDELTVPPALRRRVLEVRRGMEDHGHDLDLEVTGARYFHIDRDLPEYTRRKPAERSTSDRIDAVLTHPVWGTLIFLGIMALVFEAIFDLAEPFITALEWVVLQAQHLAALVLPAGFVVDLVVDGTLGGVGAVFTYLPQILILFLLLTVLEASGYMARGAYVIDRLMTRIGLSGRSFVPLFSGFACAVPAIMATRSIESRRDRLITIMALPLISCSARLPVYTLVIGALFPATLKVLGPISLGTVLMFGTYVVSTALTAVVASVLGRTVLKGQPAPLLLELPPYRLPPAGLVGRVLLVRCWDFLKTVGTIVVIASTVLWVLLHWPAPAASADWQAQLAAAAGDEARVESLLASHHSQELEASAAGRLGKAMEPAIEPLGFDWRIGVGLVASLAAREVFVATMGVVHGTEGESLRESLRQARAPDGSRLYTPLTGASLLVFFMIALQCMSTIAVTRAETRSWRWTTFQFAYLGGLAWVASFLVYQGGLVLGLG